tara:strand:+ start:270 stop:716 length:447 start_codon:yes stop_codon:yes gene_type:complete
VGNSTGLMKVDVLLITKFGILLLIHSGLMFGLLRIASYYKEPLFLLKRLSVKAYKIPIAVNFLVVSIVMALSVLALTQSKLTFFILNAAFLSIWFLELGVISGKHFFSSLLGDDLPKEICIFIGFILAINGGYFTLMFIVRLFSSSSF